MKFFFGSVVAIFGLFIAACIAGFFMPATLSVERSLKLEAYPGDVFPYLNDLRLYKDWSALDQKIGNTTLIQGGAETGVGQSQIWQNGPDDLEFGTREILQSQENEFVQIRLNISGHDTTTTHAIFDNEDETITVLSKRELPQPGFPYLARLRTLRVKPNLEADLDAALSRLKILVEANLES